MRSPLIIPEQTITRSEEKGIYGFLGEQINKSWRDLSFKNYKGRIP